MNWKVLSGPFVACFFTCFMALESVQANTRIVAVTGQAAPDGNGSLLRLGPPVINNSGQVAFTAQLTSTRDAGNDDDGIFRSDGTTLTQIAREGNAAPDGNGSLVSFVSGFSSTADVSLNDAGQVAFSARLTSASAEPIDDYGVFRGDGTTLTQIARVGDMAPGGNGSFSFIGEANRAFSETGQIAFHAGMTDASGGSIENSGVFRSDGTTLTQIARTGEAAPDGNESFLLFGHISLNEDGQVAFAAALTDPRDELDFSSGVFRGDETFLTQIVRRGDPAPDGNGRFTYFHAGVSSTKVALNNAGQVAFATALSDTRGEYNDDEGVFRGDGTTLTQIAREGDAAPDGNGSFSIFGEPTLNDRGAVAFRAVLASTSNGSDDNSGIFSGDETTLTQIAREGDAAPDGNGRFSGSGQHHDFLDFGNPAFNNVGQVAFIADLSSASGGVNDNRGIFFFDDRLGLRQVARESDLLLGSTVVWLRFADEDFFRGDESSGLNELGQVAYGFRLADGRFGVAVWTVPEPNALGLLALGVPILLALFRAWP